MKEFQPRPIDPNMLPDELMQCPGCLVVLHRSWFTVDSRVCRNCQAQHQHRMGLLADAVKQQADADEQIKRMMVGLAHGEEKPEGMTNQQWSVATMLARGQDASAISVAFGVTVAGAEQMIEHTMHALLDVAEERATPKETE